MVWSLLVAHSIPPHRLKRSAFGSSKPTVSTVETVTLTVFSIPRLYRSSSAAPALPGKFCFLIFVLAVLFKTAGRCCQRALQIRQVTQQVNIINHHQYLDYTLFRFSHKFSQSKTLFFILHSKSCLLLQHKKETPWSVQSNGVGFARGVNQGVRISLSKPMKWMKEGYSIGENQSWVHVGIFQFKSSTKSVSLTWSQVARQWNSW